MNDGAIQGILASRLRLEFDKSFSEPPRAGPAELRSLLAIRVAGDPYVVRLSEVTGLYADRVVAPVPGPLAELLGIAAFRGTMVPVYDLRALLGYTAPGTPRWLIVAAGPTPVALAFDGVDGHLRLSEDAAASGQKKAGREHVRGVLEAEGIVRPIIDIASIIEGVAARAGRRAPEKGV